MLWRAKLYFIADKIRAGNGAPRWTAMLGKQDEQFLLGTSMQLKDIDADDAKVY